MKKYFMALILVAQCGYIVAQNQKSDLPLVEIKSLDGEMVAAPGLVKGKPTVISFWATWCKPCIKELSAIQEALPDWEEELDFQIIAISIDDSRSEHRVAPFVKGRGWEFDVYLDPNSDLKRALNAPIIPHTFLYDASGKLVWQHSGYNEGDEEELWIQLSKLKTK